MTVPPGRFSVFQKQKFKWSRQTHELDVLLDAMTCDGFFCAPSYRKCQKVLGKNMELWENEVYRFKTIGQLKVSLG